MEVVIRKQRPSFYNKDWEILEVQEPQEYERETKNYIYKGTQQEELWINKNTNKQKVVLRRFREFRQQPK